MCPQGPAEEGVRGDVPASIDTWQMNMGNSLNRLGLRSWPYRLFGEAGADPVCCGGVRGELE